MFTVKGVTDDCKPRRYLSEAERRRRVPGSPAFYSEDAAFKPRPGDSLSVSHCRPRSRHYRKLGHGRFLSNLSQFIIH